jgi:membrane fusion protein (multidrug efflux system)
MSPAFSSSLRTLAAERGRGLELAIVLAVTLLAGWAWWMCRAELALVEVSVRASVESVAAAVPVTNLAEGRVAEVDLGLGRRVAAGEVLVTLEADRLQLEREGHVTDLAGLRAQLAASERELATLNAAIEAYERGGRARTSEVQASVREAEVEAVLAASLAARDSSLAREGFESSEAQQRSEAQRLGRAAGAATRRLQVSRTAAELRERIAMFDVERARLARQQAVRRGEIEQKEAALLAFDRKLAEHQVRAPIAGVLGQVQPLQPGAVLASNTTVAYIVPDGPLRIVAGLRPTAIGRIAPGQPVRLRLDGFPWTEYGSLRGEVLSVASEAVGGSLRVECSLDPSSAPAISLAHGLVGTLELELERVSPAALLTRTTGRAPSRALAQSPTLSRSPLLSQSPTLSRSP